MSSDADPPDELHRAVPVAGYDEMLDTDGDLRDHWRYVIGSLRMLGRADLAERRAEVRRLLRQDGAAHDSASGGHVGAWELDPVPLLVSSEDWSVVEAGLVQRAELLDLVLADLYGDQELVRRGLIPVELLHTHPGFLRPLLGSTPTGEHRLVHYCADLARSADGRFQVLADRARVPTGAGFALENRTVLSRVYPSLFRDAHVHRLAHYFRGVRRGLLAVAPPGRDDPRIVILTPGPGHPGYFEHSYLASYLGYPLVEPADLTVRRGRVWLRSLAGLRQVDVILRGTPDEQADPLELRPGVGTGIPGLVEAARGGAVSVVNPLGTAAVENIGLLPFLPDIAEHLLGAPLLLDSAPTRWCGRPADLDRVLDELDELVLVPLAPSGAGDDTPIVGAALTPTEREAVSDRIRSQPLRWAAQRYPAGGWVPCLVGDELQSRPSGLRAFLAARDGSYVAMPGALGWVAGPADAPMVPVPGASLAHQWTKDVWVLASEPERLGTSMLSDAGGPSTPAALVAPGPPTIAGTLPSRAAENLFWLGRYSERAEQLIRWSRTVLTRVSDADDRADRPAEWLDHLLRPVAVVLRSDPSAAVATTADPGAAVIAELFPGDGGGVTGILDQMVRSAGSVRELLSGDTWQVLDTIEGELSHLNRFPPRTPAAAQQALSRLLTGLLALAGLSAESTVRDPVWSFLDAGHRLERAQTLVSTARATLVPVRDQDADALVWESVLVANESLITYRRRYRARLQLASLLELLLGDRSNPRSLIYQIDRLDEHGAGLPRNDETSGGTEVQAAVAAAAGLLAGADPAVLATTTPGTGRVPLESLLVQTSGTLVAIGDALGRHFLHVEAPRSLDRPGGAGR